MAVLSLTEFEQLGQEDEKAQHAYAMSRDRKAKRVWRCADCGDRLPVKGYVWSYRWKKFCQRFRFADISSGTRCDICVECDIEY